MKFRLFVLKAKPIGSLFLISVIFFCSSDLFAAEPKFDLTNHGIELQIAVRAPAQVAAFYEARGFPQQALQRLRETCLITFRIHNQRKDVVWLELENWHFRDAKGYAVRRLDRKYWNALWETLDMPLSNRATFGWTLLPENRDLQPGESVGGNIAVVAPPRPFTLKALFHTGARKEGDDSLIRAEAIICPGHAVPNPGEARP